MKNNIIRDAHTLHYTLFGRTETILFLISVKNDAYNQAYSQTDGCGCSNGKSTGIAEIELTVDPEGTITCGMNIAVFTQAGPQLYLTAVTVF